MLGAIIGDIVGSIYEFNNIRSKQFVFFPSNAFFTDDTVMSIASADALMGDLDFAKAYRKWGRDYPDESYGNSFRTWLRTDAGPYNSYGNGSAMRVAPCAWMVKADDDRPEDLALVLDLAGKSAAVSHNHPEGIKGAQATAMAIYLARIGHARDQTQQTKHWIKQEIQSRFGYDLSRSLADVYKVYKYNETCQQTVPEAIIAYLEADDFEDAIRNAISLGGDSDTLAAITGSIAEAAFGIPNTMREQALSYLDERIRGRYLDFMHFIKDRRS